MKTEKALALLESRHESLDVEVKNWLDGLSSAEKKCRLAKEIIALANNGGGYVLIGFDDAEGHPEIEPEEGELEAFTQDTLSSLVERYTEPSCQVRAHRQSLPGSDIQHPIIEVPGKHRTPIWAKRQSPDGTNILQTGTVYVRRPGGSSEPARTQDDWERLIDRLVRARQSDLVDAMRNVLNPTEAPESVGIETLENWQQQSEAAWNSKIENLPAEDLRRFPAGYWEASFAISDFECESVRVLHRFISQEMPRLGGWPPFVVVNNEERGPVPNGNVVEAWLGGFPEAVFRAGDEQLSNYWRLSVGGFGYLLGPFSEDDPSYCQNRVPRPVGKFFDTVFHPYNIVEILLAIRALATRFAAEGGTYRLRLRYAGMKTRNLKVHSLQWGFGRGGQCEAERIETEHSGFLSNLENGINEEALLILAPVYEQFEFAEVNRHAIRKAVDDLGGT